MIYPLKVAATDPVFAFAKPSSLVFLKDWSTGRTVKPHPDLRLMIPSLFVVIGGTPPSRMSILRRFGLWLGSRMVQVIRHLGPHFTPPITPLPPPTSHYLTGSCYGLPEVRRRPIYTGLTNDGKLGRLETSGAAEGGSDVRSDHVAPPKGTCRKFYEKQGKARMSGGILAMWCSHGVCLGFHMIPAGEGRDDVFSVLFTRSVLPFRLPFRPIDLHADTPSRSSSAAVSRSRLVP